MMGVKIDGLCDMYCDNDSVVKNVSRPESPIKKKHNSVAYHKACKLIAAGVMRIAKVKGTSNIADLFTKLLTGTAYTAMAKRCMWRN